MSTDVSWRDREPSGPVASLRDLRRVLRRRARRRLRVAGARDARARAARASVVARALGWPDPAAAAADPRAFAWPREMPHRDWHALTAAPESASERE